jgi:hypothetical protein
MMQHPAVQNAVALVRKEKAGVNQIIAYVVPEPALLSAPPNYRISPGKRCRSIWCPVHIIIMDNLPLTANGKVDRHSLPAPGDVRRLSGYTAPRNKTEQTLVSIWQDVLEVENVGINDNFFDLGGASLQSLEMVAKATMLGLPLTVEAIFEHQTIAGLSAHLSTPS